MSMKKLIEKFDFPGTFVEHRAYGNGHINDTYRLVFVCEDGNKSYILQRMNRQVFKNPEQLMENIEGVTSWLKKKIAEKGGDVTRETLTLVYAKDGKSYCIDDAGEYWRAYLLVEGVSSYDLVENIRDFYESAVAFGNFQCLLSDYPAETLHETIPDFHNTPSRFETFKKVLADDVCGRASDAQKEIQFVLEREAFTHKLMDLQESGQLPLRVTHNDTKLNNVLIDDATGKAVCVVDLDTVMPGLSVNDFGDAIRFGASTGAEDERDLDKVWCDLDLFEAFVMGYTRGCAGSLTKTEMDHLVTGAKMMTFECGMRFLTDHLDGDHYFKIHREGHNLDRCRTQFKLLKDMEDKEEQMQEIVNKYR